VSNPRNSCLFDAQQHAGLDRTKNYQSSKFELLTNNSKKAQSRSMQSLNHLNGTILPTNNRLSNYINTNSVNYQEMMIIKNDNNDKSRTKNKSKMKQSSTVDDIKHFNILHQNDNLKSQPVTIITGITKSCISNPCAFQHINSFKNGDERVKMLLKATLLSTDSIHFDSKKQAVKGGKKYFNNKRS
jgi:hypothetical protein